MVDQATKEVLLKELTGMQEELDTLLAYKPQPEVKNSTSVLSLLFFSGMLSLVLFFVMVMQSAIAFQGVALISYLVAAGVLFPVLHVAYQSKQSLLQGLGLGCVVLLAVGFVLLWFLVIKQHVVLMIIILGVIFGLLTLALAGFGLIAYILRRKLFLMRIIFVWVLAATAILAFALYQQVIVFLLADLALLWLLAVMKIQANESRVQPQAQKKSSWLEEKKEREKKFHGFDDE